ncbi:TPA: hypothetical protein KD866_003325 [Vibrio parahaemolyticus]|nr:hypothetical protein [Vibrio parahaemolyticus]
MVLIYITYSVNKTELKQTQEALKRQNVIDINAQKEASLVRMCKEISSIIHSTNYLIDKDISVYNPISVWGYQVVKNHDNPPDIIKAYINATEGKSQSDEVYLEDVHKLFIKNYSQKFDGSFNKRSYRSYIERYLEESIDDFFYGPELIEINYVIAKLEDRIIQTDFYSKMATLCYIFNEIDPVNKKISDLIIDCEIGWESIAMYYLYSKHCSFKGHYAVDHKIIEQSITEIASLTNFKPTFVELENKYTGLF